MSSQCNNIEMSVLGDPKPYQLISQVGISREIESAISKVQSYLKLSPDQCLTLLLKFKWDIDSLKETFDAFYDSHKFLTENNIVPRETVISSSLECSICCFEGKLLSFACGHQACEDCWRQYFGGKIQDGEVLLECMDSSCNLLSCLTTIANDGGLEASYKKLLIHSYVEGSSEITWCNQECGMAIKRLKMTNSKNVICPCGSEFCFPCGRAYHLPATCQQVELWGKKCATMQPPGKSNSSDAITQEWLLTHTKRCPRCSTPIEKNGGCSHMKCSNKKCRFVFCWNCHEAWITHGPRCNKVKLAAIQSHVNEEVTSKVFQLYFEKIEKQRKHIEQEESLHESSKLLLECRQTLIHSYIFAFYQNRGSFFNKFEEMQEKLEQQTDKLSKTLKNSLGNAEAMKDVDAAAQNCEVTRMELRTYCSTGNHYENLDGEGHTALLELNPDDDDCLNPLKLSSVLVAGYSAFSVAKTPTSLQLAGNGSFGIRNANCSHQN